MKALRQRRVFDLACTLVPFRDPAFIRPRSVYLLSHSGSTHAALACHGDAGGTVRLGLPQPTSPPPGQPHVAPTALQRLYLTGVRAGRADWLAGWLAG